MRVAAALLVTALAFAACGGSAGRATPTHQNTALSSPAAATPVAGDPTSAVAAAVVACREKDTAKLRALVAPPPSAAEIDALFGRGNDVLLKGQTPSANGDQASVTVYLDVQRATGAESLQRTWTLARGRDGVWRFTALPDCY